MKVLGVSPKSDRSGHVTLGEARRAARVVKAKRAVRKFEVANSKQNRVLHEKYLGEIVPTGGSAGSNGSSGRASSGSGASRTAAKKK